MQTQRRSFLCAIALLAAGTPNLLLAQKASPSTPLSDAALSLRASTLGIGFEAGKLLTSHLSVRVGANFGSLSPTSSRSDISYETSIKFKAVSALVDLYLKNRGNFHFTGGLVTNPLTFTGTGQPGSSGTFTINSHDYTAAQVGTLTATGKFAGVGPYLGLGFGTPARKGGRIKFLFDIGTVIGSAKVTLGATGAGSNAQLASDLEAQRAKTQKDIDKVAKVYPVISFGVSYHF
jgi:hypothetical protein